MGGEPPDRARTHPSDAVAAYPLDHTGQATYDVHRNRHQGKVGVLCLAPEEGLGVRDGETRATHLEAISRFRNV